MKEAALLLCASRYIGLNRPLSNLIRKYVSAEKLRGSGTKIIVTQSVYDYYFDPYEPYYEVPDIHENQGQ